VAQVSSKAGTSPNSISPKPISTNGNVPTPKPQQNSSAAPLEPSNEASLGAARTNATNFASNRTNAVAAKAVGNSFHQPASGAKSLAHTSATGTNVSRRPSESELGSFFHTPTPSTKSSTKTPVRTNIPSNTTEPDVVVVPRPSTMPARSQPQSSSKKTSPGSHDRVLGNHSPGRIESTQKKSRAAGLNGTHGATSHSTPGAAATTRTSVNNTSIDGLLTSSPTPRNNGKTSRTPPARNIMEATPTHAGNREKAMTPSQTSTHQEKPASSLTANAFDRARSAELNEQISSKRKARDLENEPSRLAGASDHVEEEKKDSADGLGSRECPLVLDDDEDNDDDETVSEPEDMHINRSTVTGQRGMSAPAPKRARLDGAKTLNKLGHGGDRNTNEIREENTAAAIEHAAYHHPEGYLGDPV